MGDMYIEISTRNSGKTKRLVAAVVDYLNADPGHRAIIVIPNIQAFSNFAAMIKFRNGDIGRTSFTYTMQGATSTFPKLTRFFVHDFEEIPDEHLEIIPGAYYVTSLRKKRQPGERDFLTELVAANGGKYSQYGFGGDYRALIDQIGYAAYRRLTDGEFQIPDRREQNEKRIREILIKVGFDELTDLWHRAAPAHGSSRTVRLGFDTDGFIQDLAHACEKSGYYIASNDD